MNWPSIKQAMAARFFGDVIRLREVEAMAAAEYCQQAAAEGRIAQAVAQETAKIRQALPSLSTWEPTLAGFRRFTGSQDLQSTLRDLSPIDQERQAQIGHFLFATNPMAKWMIRIGAAYQLGGGVSLVCEDPDTQELLDRFWRDPVNQWDVKLAQKVMDLGIFGEQCWPRFVAPGTGRVRLGYLDPTLIGQVILDPENAEQPIGIVTRQWMNAAYQQPVKKYRVVLPIDEDELTLDTQRLRAEFTDGDCYYFAINKVSNGSRGISELYDVADHLDGYEQFMFNRIERADLANRVVTDVTVTGATDAEIQERAKNFRLPPAGGAHIHNEKVALDVKAPKLEAADAAEDARLFRNQCLRGFPEHWFGGGGDVNRATAAEMDEPTFKLLELAQNYTAWMLKTVALDQIRQSKRVGALRQGASEIVQVQMPEMVKADMAKLGVGYQTVSATSSANVQAGLMTEEEARQLIALFVKPFGIDLKPLTQEELQRMKAERDLADASRDYQPGGPADKAFRGGRGNGSRHSNGREAVLSGNGPLDRLGAGR